jgi:hypothetical protein
MTSFGQYPLVYQLKQLGDGSFIPIGLAEASSLGSFSATNIVVSSISATNYQGLNLSSIEITGVIVSLDTTGTGQPILDNTTPATPKIRSFAVSLGDFLTTPLVSPGDGEVTISFGSTPLPLANGGTAATTKEDAQINLSLVPGSDIQPYDLNLTELSNLTLSNRAILVGGAGSTLTTIAAPTTANTFLNYNGANLIWTGVAAGSTSFPGTAGRIPITYSNSELVTYADLSYASATKALSVYAINNVCDVCAVRFNEGGTLLSDKYQGKDETLTTIAGLNPGANQLIYFNGTNTAATAALTPLARDILADSTAADMRSTLVLGNIATRDITSPPAGGLYFENDPTGTINTNSNLTFTTNILKSPNVCATTVCATTFTEGGQTLSTKYQGFDSFLTTLATQDTVNLSTQVCGSLPVSKGGTGLTNISTNQIVYGSDDGVISVISAPGTPNTFLNYNGTTLIWTGVAAGTSTSIPNQPGRIPVIYSDTALISYSELSYASATKALSVYAINNVCDVCAVRFNEGGTLLADKYQVCDVVLNSIASLNPNANELIYFTNTNTAATASLTEQGRNLLDDTSFAAMRTTLQLSALATKSQVSLTSDVTDTLSVPNGGTGKTSFTSDQLIFGNDFSQDATLTFNKTTKILNVSSFSATNSSAVTFTENGQTLSSKYQPVGSYLTSIPSEYLTQTEGDGLYQPCDVFLTTLATQDTVNLTAGQVCGTLPLAKGGTNKTSFNLNELIYGQFSQDANLTYTSNTLKSPTVCATTVCGADLFENGVNITTKYETQTNAANTYTTKSTYNTFTGTLALSAGLKDVSFGTLSNGQVLKWNGSSWANATDTFTYTDSRESGGDAVLFFEASNSSFHLMSNKPSNSLAEYVIPAISRTGDRVLLDYFDNQARLAPPEFTTSAAPNYSALIVEDLSSTNHYNENSYIFYAEVATISATTYQNLPNVSALAGTGVFEVTSYSRTNYVLTSTNLALSNTVTGHLASAVHWDLATLNNNYVNASGDSVTGSFYFGNLSAAVFSATTISATNAYIASAVQFNTGITPTLAVGQMSWNSTDQTLDIQTTVDTTLQIGQEQVMLVENKSGAAIQNGKVVYVSGTTGGSGKLNVGLAAASSTNSETAFIIGVATQNINDNSTGFVTTFGKVNGIPLPTSAFSDGDIAYLGDTPGELRNYKPGKPSHGSFQMGRVVRAHNTNGILFVTIRGSVDMSEIHDVASSTPSNGQVLVWNTASGVYEPKNVSAISGINNYTTTASLQDHISSAVHWDLTTLNNNYINASGDSVTGAFFFGTLSATTLSATTYRNLPTSALSGLSDVQITSPALSSVLKWNGTKWVPATDQTGGGGGSPGGTQYHIQVNDGAGGFYGDASLQYDYDTPQITINTALIVDSVATFNGGTDFTQAGTFTTLRGTGVSSTTVSATNYLNLPSGVATWNANKINGYSITSSTPAIGSLLIYQFPDFGNAIWQYYGAEDLGELAIFNAEKLQSRPISTATPTTNDTLVYNGTTWAPSPADGLTKSLITQSFGGF